MKINAKDFQFTIPLPVFQTPLCSVVDCPYIQPALYQLRFSIAQHDTVTVDLSRPAGLFILPRLSYRPNLQARRE